MFSKRSLTIFLCILLLIGIAYAALSKNQKLSIAYVLDDLKQPGATVMLGSSTITRFPTQLLQHCKAPKVRGFSNGHGSDVINYIRWREIDEAANIFIYVGENDIAHGKSVQRSLNDLNEIVAYFEKYPNTSIAILLIKPSPARHIFHHDYEHFNQLLTQKYQDKDNIHFIEMNEFRSPTLYLDDGVHFTQPAYKQLAGLVDDVCLKSTSL